MEAYRYTKETLRHSFLHKRGLLSKEFINAKSAFISKKLLTFLDKYDFRNVVSYKSINNEVDIDLSFAKKRLNIFYTKIYGDNLSIAKSKNFKIKKYGIKEPFCGVYIFKKKIDCFIVPGLVFDNKGYRIGYGMGFYDRFLKGSSALKIGVGFDMQILNHDIVSESFDVTLDFIITEKKIINCRRYRLCRLAL